MSKDEKNRSKKIQVEWGDLSEKEKEKLEKEYREELVEYEEHLKKW